MPEGHRATAIYFRHLLLIRVEIENIVNTLAICRHTFYISSLSLPCNLNKLIIMENLQSNLFYSCLPCILYKQAENDRTKAAEHRLYYDRRPYSPDDELL